MDELMKEKLRKIATDLETSKGALKLFACVWQDEVKKWDIVISADWISNTSLKDDIGVVFDAFKKQFNGEYALRFSGIYPVMINAPFVEEVTKLFSNLQEILEVSEVQISNFKIDKMVLVISKV